MTRKLIIVLVAVFYICSCETVVQLDVPQKDNQLVINSLFHPDSTFGITLSQSQHVLDDGEFKEVTGATAIVMDEKGSELATLQEQEPGSYTSNLKPKPGQSYQIEVSKSGFATATATDAVPRDSAQITKYEVKRVSNSHNSIRLSIWIDDPKSKDYYQLYGRENVTIYGEEIDTTLYEEEVYFASDDPVFGDYGNNRQRLFFDDVLFDGQVKKLNIQTSVGRYQCSPMSDVCDQEIEVTLYLRKLSEAYFNYIETSFLQDDLNDDPFAEPVPVYDNIKNGVGIFGGFRVSEYPIEIPGNQSDQ